MVKFTHSILPPDPMFGRKVNLCQYVCYMIVNNRVRGVLNSAIILPHFTKFIRKYDK